jgi:hypothetical protein
MRKQWRKAKKEAEAERESKNRELSDIMRRRRATDPSPYDPYGSGGPGQPGAVSGLADHLGGMHPSDMPVPGYALSGAGMDPSIGGYGAHHYVAPGAYAPHQHQQQQQRAPISPQSDSPPPGARGNMLAQLTLPSLPGAPGGNGGGGGGYDALEGGGGGGNGGMGGGGGAPHHGYGSHHPHSHPPSPPPLNRLPQDSVLLTPLGGHGYGQHGSGGGEYPGLPPLGRISEHHHS